MHGPAVHALSKWQSPMHHQPPTTMQRLQLIEHGANNTKVVGLSHMDHSLERLTRWSLWVPSKSEYSLILVLLLQIISAKRRSNLQIATVLPVNAPIHQQIPVCLVEIRQEPTSAPCPLPWTAHEAHGAHKSLWGPHTSQHKHSKSKQIQILHLHHARLSACLPFCKGQICHVHLPTSTRRHCNLTAASSEKSLLSGKWGEGNTMSAQDDPGIASQNPNWTLFWVQRIHKHQVQHLSEWSTQGLILQPWC